MGVLPFVGDDLLELKNEVCLKPFCGLLGDYSDSLKTVIGKILIKVSE
jgi:hypothetical protein